MKHNINIIFDYHFFALQKYGGISRYFVELALHLKNIEACKPHVLSPLGTNIYLKKLDRDIYKPRYLVQKFWNKVEEKIVKIIINSFSSKDSLLHETYYTKKAKTYLPVVTTVHDMIYELYASGTEEEKIVLAKKKESILQSAHIICVSNSTKKDLLQFYHEVKRKVSVIHHSVSLINKAHYKAYAHKKSYLLFVGLRYCYAYNIG